MEETCAAFGCNNRFGTEDGEGNKFQFHRFPLSNIELLKKWISAIGRNDWFPNKYSYICSLHFEKADYHIDPITSKQILMKDAVPSIFSFLQCLTENGSENQHLPQDVENKQNISNDVNIKTERGVSNMDKQHSSLGTEDQQPCTSLVPVDIKVIEMSKNVERTKVRQRKRIPRKIPNDENVQIVPDIFDIGELQPFTSSIPMDLQVISQNSEETIARHRKGQTQKETKVENSPISKRTRHKSTTSSFVMTEKETQTYQDPDEEQNRKKHIKMLQRKVKILQQQLKRREKKLISFKALLNTAKGLLPNNLSDIYEDKFCIMPFQFLMQQLQNNNVKCNARRYTTAVKEFAIELYNCSPKAYQFIRQSFNLPCPSLVRSWASLNRRKENELESSAGGLPTHTPNGNNIPVKTPTIDYTNLDSVIEEVASKGNYIKCEETVADTGSESWQHEVDSAAVNNFEYFINYNKVPTSGENNVGEMHVTPDIWTEN